MRRTCALSVFVGKDRGSCGVKTRRLLSDMVEVTVGVRTPLLNRSVAKAIESLFEPGQAGATKVFPQPNCRQGPLKGYTLPPGQSNSDIVTSFGFDRETA